ncbi:MAG: hypothetical protein J5602_04775 [Clostridia bacterium]|nr:hypothetical protein [Clostridia bacterium]MBO4884606.1 hypothetical protein [Clostridia bacterium]
MYTYLGCSPFPTGANAGFTPVGRIAGFRTDGRLAFYGYAQNILRMAAQAMIDLIRNDAET